jgi:hypothetical protein
MKPAPHAALLSILALGCGSTGPSEVRYAIVAEGRASVPSSAGEWTITLDVARVSLGPIYFCATAAASSSLCPAAVQEFADSAEFDALRPSAQPLGFVTGAPGSIRSASYDFGLTWFTTQRMVTPTVASAGRSAHFEGHATRGDRTLRFVCDVRVTPMIRGAQTVQGARVNADVGSARVRLVVHADPGAWWRAVDLSEVESQGGDPVVIPPSSRVHNAVVVAMTASSPLRFEWVPE